MNQMSGIRADGLLDVVSGMRPYGALSNNHLFFDSEWLYERDGIAATIVEKPADDAVSCGFTIEGDENNFILNEFDRIDAFAAINEAIRLARLRGASALFILAQDGKDLREPIDINNLEVIDSLIPYPGMSINAREQRYTDARLKNYGHPVFYELSPEYGLPFVVHESRLIKFTGDKSGRNYRVASNLPWQGKSVLGACHEDLSNYRTCLQLAREIMKRKQQAVHSMAGLSELLGSEEGKSIVRDKIALTDAVRGLLNGITIDGGPGNGEGDGDKYTIIDLSLGGIDIVVGAMQTALSASSKIPQVILFGSDIKGLGSRGEGEQSIYHSLIRSIHERNMRPAIEYLAGLLWAQKVAKESEPETWRLLFGSLFSPSAKEMAETDQIKANARKTTMEALQIGRDIEAISPEEARSGADLAFPELDLKNTVYEPPLPDEPLDPANPANAGDTVTGGNDTLAGSA
jgi:hypothetical protein